MTGMMRFVGIPRGYTLAALLILSGAQTADAELITFEFDRSSLSRKFELLRSREWR